MLKNTKMQEFLNAKLDDRAGFSNSFCKFGSQNQVLGLKLAASIPSRRGAPARTCPGTFWTVICWYHWFLNFPKTHIICCYNWKFSIPRFDNRARFWSSFCKIWSENQDLGLKLAASILTRRGASIGTHFDLYFAPDLTQNGFRILGVWASYFPMVLLD